MRLHYYIRPVNQRRLPPLLLSLKAFPFFSAIFLCYLRVELGSIKFLLRDANFNARGEIYPNARELINMRYVTWGYRTTNQVIALSRGVIALSRGVIALHRKNYTFIRTGK